MMVRALTSSSCLHRLRNLSEILDKHISYLRAAVALESLSPSSESGPEPGADAKDQGASDREGRADGSPTDDDSSQTSN